MRTKLGTAMATAFHGCQHDPKRLIKYVVLVVCSIAVVFQLAECFSKLFNPPVATHSFFDLNETVSYPALTFCRNPAYKEPVMRYYNLSLHPRLTNHWRRFRFGEHNLSAVFDNMTYAADETLILYSLDEERQNVDIVTRLYLKYGRCHTVMPRVTTRGSWKRHGFSLYLGHDSLAPDGLDGQPAGWHMFVHEPAEAFTEINMETSGRSEYMFVRVNENIEIKLTAQHFNALSSREEPCELSAAYEGFNACAERCQWRQVAERANCSGPWMRGMDERWPHCGDYDSMRALIADYVNLTEYNHTVCDCQEPCRTVIYSANIISRNAMPNDVLGSVLYLYYASKMVTIYQEQPGYDLNQFVADIGGSLGFLLGLSVLGLIGMLEKITSWIVNCYKTKEDPDADRPIEKNQTPQPSSVSTIDIKDANSR